MKQWTIFFSVVAVVGVCLYCCSLSIRPESLHSYALKVSKWSNFVWQQQQLGVVDDWSHRLAVLEERIRVEYQDEFDHLEHRIRELERVLERFGEMQSFYPANYDNELDADETNDGIDFFDDLKIDEHAVLRDPNVRALKRTKPGTGGGRGGGGRGKKSKKNKKAGNKKKATSVPDAIMYPTSESSTDNDSRDYSQYVYGQTVVTSVNVKASSSKKKKKKSGIKKEVREMSNSSYVSMQNATMYPTSGNTTDDDSGDNSPYTPDQTYVTYDDFTTLLNQFSKLSQALSCLEMDQSSKTSLVFEGCNVQIRNGNVQKQTLLANGYGNLIIGYAEKDSCLDNSCARTGSHNLVLGMNNDWLSSGGIVAGEGNRIMGSLSTVLGGYRNTAMGLTSTVTGGRQNVASGEDSVMVGGEQNVVSGIRAVVVGGIFNEASGRSAAVLSGSQNKATGLNAGVAGGALNVASGAYATVGAGQSNIAAGTGSFVAGGESNQASGTQSFVAGGLSQIATEQNEVQISSKNNR